MTKVPNKLSMLQRINFRMLIFLAVIGAFVGYPLYQGMEVALTGGIVKHHDYVAVDLKSMSNFEMDQNNGTLDDVPIQYRELDGQRVQLEGEMWSPSASGNHVDNFVLVYSITKCCIGPVIKVQHLVISAVPANVSASFYQGQVRVVGKLHIKVHREEGKDPVLYTLDVESVEPKG